MEVSFACLKIWQSLIELPSDGVPCPIWCYNLPPSPTRSYGHVATCLGINYMYLLCPFNLFFLVSGFLFLLRYPHAHENVKSCSFKAVFGTHNHWAQTLLKHFTPTLTCHPLIWSCPRSTCPYTGARRLEVGLLITSVCRRQDSENPTICMRCDTLIDYIT